MDQSLVDSLTADQLPNDDLLYLSEIIGLDAAKKVFMVCGGMSFYIPKTLSRAYYLDYIHKNYDPAKKNARALARILGIAEQTVYEMLRAKIPKK